MNNRENEQVAADIAVTIRSNAMTRELKFDVMRLSGCFEAARIILQSQFQHVTPEMITTIAVHISKLDHDIGDLH